MNRNNRWILGSLLALCLALSGEAKVKLPLLVADGMVLQREQPIKIWGWAEAHEEIKVTFRKKSYLTKADEKGNWQVTLEASKAGGPYSMTINEITLHDILIGDLFLFSGQSNMETTIARVMDRYAEEILTYENRNIRHIKLAHDYSFTPKEEVKGGTWQPIEQAYMQAMTAVPYFFGRLLYEEKKVPIGLVNTAVGGSPIEAWVNENYLSDFPHYLIDKRISAAEGYVEAVERLQQQRNHLYHEELNRNDIGLKENWKSPLLDDSSWRNVDMFENWAHDGTSFLTGSHWLRKEVEVPSHVVGKVATLRLGSIVDADSVFVNGIFVGHTTYQYPPRIYTIPAGLLKEGKNNITIRLFCRDGRAHFIEDKPYKIVCGSEEISLLGEWKHRLGCRMFSLPGGVGFNSKASVLYNALIAPLKQMTFKGVLWYQGESNAGRHYEYYPLFSALVESWRNLFGNPELPFITAQLPNYMATRPYPSEGSWAQLREVQSTLARELPHVGMTVNIDLGEWNDIHPLNKKDVAYRMRLQAERMCYGNENIVADGPIVDSFEIKENKFIITFKAGGNELMQVDELKGFAIAGSDGRFQWAKAKIEGRQVVVWHDEIGAPKRVRYAWADNPGEVNLRNQSGLPASPFQLGL